MYDPSQMYGGGEQTGVGGGYQQPVTEGANAIGMGGYGGGKNNLFT